MFKRSTKKGPEIGKEDFAYSKKGGKWHKKLTNKYAWYDHYHQHKWSTPVNFAVLAIFSVSIAAVAVISLRSDAATTSFTLQSPYSYSSTNYTYKANLHAHTNYGPEGDSRTCNNDDADAASTPTTVAQWYKNNGFSFYALTGHVDPHYLRCDPESAGSGQKFVRDVNVNPATGATYNTNWWQLFRNAVNQKTFPCIMSYTNTAGNNYCTTPSRWIQGSLVGTVPPSDDNASVRTATQLPFRWAGISAEVNMFPQPVVVKNPSDAVVSQSYLSGSKMNGVHVGLINLSNSSSATLVSTMTSTIGGVRNSVYVPVWDSMLKVDYAGVSETISKVITGGTSGSGLAIIHHPVTGGSVDRTSADKVAGMPNVTGVEIRNSTSNFTGFWDEQLKKGRWLWGFGGDDSHEVSKIDSNYSTERNRRRGMSYIVINSPLPNPTRNQLIDAVKRGNFIVSSPIASIQSNAPYDLKIEIINGTTIQATSIHGEYIRFVVNGNTLSATGKSYNKAWYTPTAADKYVRVEVFSSCWTAPEAVTNFTPPHCMLPVAYSQPIRVVPAP